MTDRGDDHRRTREALRETLVQLESLLKALPGTTELQRRVAELRKLILEQRPPRLALVGRRGSGKSSLVNALFGEEVAVVGHEKAQTGEPAWFSYRSERGVLDILDTRGFQEGSKPEGSDAASTPLESVRLALDRTAPDVLLFLIRAGDVDAAVDEDIRLLRAVSTEADRRHGGKIPIVAVVTHCDQVEPKNTRLHATSGEDPDDIREKLGRVESIKRHLRQKLTAIPALHDRLAEVLGVSTYQSWRADKTRRADERWQIEALVAYVFSELPVEARLDMARLAKVRKIQRELASHLTTVAAGLTATIAATPIPVADIAPITTVQLTLILAIGYLSGRTLTMSAAAELMGALGVNVGSAYVLREAARALARLIPGGSLVSAAVAYAGTYGLGKTASAYFIDDVKKEDLGKVYEGARREADQRPERPDG